MKFLIVLIVLMVQWNAYAEEIKIFKGVSSALDSSELWARVKGRLDPFKITKMEYKNPYVLQTVV